jgi:hypothetical protein
MVEEPASGSYSWLGLKTTGEFQGSGFRVGMGYSGATGTNINIIKFI